MKGITITEENDKNTYFCILEGRLEANNADETYEELIKRFDEHKGEYVIIDLEKLSYVSSAGLRILLKIHKRYNKKLILTNVSVQVYEILATTGFTEIFTVLHTPKKIDVSSCEVVGQGAFGKVYAIDDENIVKIYPQSHSLVSLAREKEAAKKLFVKGVPTAIPYDLVCVEGEGYGLEYEMVKAGTLQSALIQNPDNLIPYMEKFVDILKSLHSVTADDKSFPSAKQDILNNLALYENFYSAQMMEDYYRTLNAIPETNFLVHQDFHLGNILMDLNGDTMLIDLGDVGTGHPAIDLMTVAMHYPVLCCNPEFKAHALKSHGGMSEELHEKVWKAFLDIYFKGRSEAEKEKYRKLLAWLGAVYTSIVPLRFPEAIRPGVLKDACIKYENAHDGIQFLDCIEELA